MHSKNIREEFTNGELDEYCSWLDNDSNNINASDGGIIYVDGRYYWYGLSLRTLPFSSLGKGGQTTKTGVVMYSSTDLYNWNYEGVVLRCSEDMDSDLYCPMRFERPKIIYNKKANKFVLWCHYVKHPGDHGVAIGTAEAGVASCNTINGEYEWHGYTRPINQAGAVRDCTLYKDKDGTGYFIYDRDENDNRCLHIVKLSDDYLSFTNIYRRIDAASRREAASIFYNNGYYFMITSGLSGWEPNGAKYYRTESLLSDWTDMGDPCVGEGKELTFQSQSSYILPVEGKEGLFIHMAERHNIKNFEQCSYIWLPIEFPTPDTLRLVYRKTWRYED